MKKKSSKASDQLPKGWNSAKVRALIDFYESQSEDDAVAEDEAAWSDPKVTMMAVPVELVSKVQKLIARKAS